MLTLQRPHREADINGDIILGRGSEGFRYRKCGISAINWSVRDPARFTRFSRLYAAMQDHYAKVDWAQRRELQELAKTVGS